MFVKNIQLSPIMSKGCRFQSISCMSEYKDRSYEELRSEYYEAYRKWRASFRPAMLFFGVPIFPFSSKNEQPQKRIFIPPVQDNSEVFVPPVIHDIMIKAGREVNVKARLQSITCLKEYADMSFEELKYNDLAENKETPQLLMTSFKTAQTPLFGASASTSAFGNQQTTPFGFGTTSTSGSVFGNCTQQNTILSFGINTQQQTSTHFGTSNTSSFGTPYPMFGEVGSTSTGLFQQSKNNGTSFSFNNTQQASSSMPFGTNNTPTFGTPVLAFGETGNTSAATGLWGQSANKSANFSGFTSLAKPTTSGAIFETNTQYTFPIFGKNNTSTFETSTPTFGGTSNTNEGTGLWGQSPNKTTTFPGFPSPNQSSTSDSNFSTNAQQTSSATPFATDTTSIFGTPISDFGVIGCTSTSKGVWSQSINVNNNSSLVSLSTKTSTNTVNNWAKGRLNDLSTQKTSPTTPLVTNNVFRTSIPTFGVASGTSTGKEELGQIRNSDHIFSGSTTPTQTSTSGSYFGINSAQQTSSATPSATNSNFIFGAPISSTLTAKGPWDQSGNASSNLSDITTPNQTSTTGSYFSTKAKQTSSTTNSAFNFETPVGCTPTAKGSWDQSGNASSNFSGITIPTQTPTSGSYFSTNAQQTSSATPFATNSTFIFKAPISSTSTAKGQWDQSGNASSNFSGIATPTQTSISGSYFSTSAKQTLSATNSPFRFETPVGCMPTAKGSWGQSRNASSNFSGITIPTETATSGSYFSTNAQQTSSATPSATNSTFIIRDPISSTPTAKGPWGQSGNANSNLCGITTPTQTSTSGSYFGTNIQQTSSATPSAANSTFVFRAPVGCTPTAKGSWGQSGNASSNFCESTVSTKTSTNTVNNWANGRLNDLSTQKISPTTPLVTNIVFRNSIPTFGVASGTSTGEEQCGQSRNSDHNLSGSTTGFKIQPSGTKFKFKHCTGTDMIMEGGVAILTRTRHHCITIMIEYENKSLEELRMEDYAVNRKGPPIWNTFPILSLYNQMRPINPIPQQPSARIVEMPLGYIAAVSNPGF